MGAGRGVKLDNTEKTGNRLEVIKKSRRTRKPRFAFHRTRICRESLMNLPPPRYPTILVFSSLRINAA